jgi:glycosyltransferase involved in cell wall biosynthesis
VKVILIRSRAIDPAVHKIARTLAKNGCDVTLLLWDRQNNSDNNDFEYKIAKFKLAAPYDKLSALLFLPFWWVYEFVFLLRNEADVIHACDLDTLYPAIIAKSIKRVRLFYIIYDFYASNLPDGFPRYVRKLIRRLVAFIEKYGIKFTDALFLVDESRYEEVKGSQIKKLEYIYNTPPDFVQKYKVEQQSSNHDFRIFYGGLLHKSRGLEYMIEAVKELDNVKLIIAGAGVDSGIIKKAAQQTNKIYYIGYISYEKLIKYTMKADVLFAFYDPSVPNNKRASPNKLFEAMMCGKPIIVSDGSSMANIVRSENCGVVVPYGDVDAIKSIVVNLKNNSAICCSIGKNGRIAYDKKYSWRIMEDRLLKVYQDV